MTTARDIRGRRAIRTVEYSTWPIDGLLDRLRAQGIKLVMDVRTILRLRHHPEFNRETLPQTLRRDGIWRYSSTRTGGLGMRSGILRTWAGAIPRSGDMPMTCRHRNLKSASTR